MKKILITITFIIFTTSIFAQFGDLLRFNSGGMVNLQWNIAKPVGSMSDFVGNTSLSGFNIGYRHCYKNNFIIGGRTGLISFYEYLGFTNVNVDNTTTYSRVENRVNAVPILFIVDYMYNSDKLIPYVGIGIGTYFINTSTTSDNVTLKSNNSFHFGVSPEVGITIPFIVSNFGLNLSSRYNYALGAGSSSGYSWFDFTIGISFMY
jgi:hypothetical protein